MYSSYCLDLHGNQSKKATRFVRPVVLFFSQKGVSHHEKGELNQNQLGFNLTNDYLVTKANPAAVLTGLNVNLYSHVEIQRQSSVPHKVTQLALLPLWGGHWLGQKREVEVMVIINV